MDDKTYITKLNDRVSMIEKTFWHRGEEYTKVFAYDKTNNMIEKIATAYNEMKYYFNSNYIVFVKDEDVEFAFDTRKFSFISDEIGKMRAFKNILKSSKSEYTKEETDLKLEKETRYMIKKYIKNEE